MSSSDQSTTQKSTKPIGLPYYIAAILIGIGFFVYLVMPDPPRSRENPRRTQCQMNLKNLALALLTRNAGDAPGEY